MSPKVYRIPYGFLLLLLFWPALAFSQTSNPSLHGQVLDPSGAAIPALSVTVVGPTGAKVVAQTDEQGRYAFRNLAPGTYSLTITLQGFEGFVKPGIVIARGQSPVVNAQLAVAVAKQQITVSDTTTKVSVNPDENASALVIKGKDLEALSDDPDELESELQALAGPSAGPNGGQIYIDGFTGGQLPSKSSIREIRVNQNPFSAQYDSLGYGRIEILTKPGTDKLHGQLFADGNDSAFNTRNPFATNIPGYHSEMFNGNIGGPINKKTSFYVDGQRRDIEDTGIVNATVLDPNLNLTTLVEAVPTPQTQTNFSPRIDTQFGNNNTLTVRYSLWQNSENNNNVGQFNLPSSAYNSSERYQSIQLSDAQVINEKAVTEVRFRYFRDDETQSPANSLPTVSVLGAFVSGASNAGTMDTSTNAYELQDYTSVTLKKNFLKFGARFRDNQESARSNANFFGTFTFPSITAYQITEQGLQAGLTPAQIQANGGGASQFSLIGGNPLASVGVYDFEPYVEDDWKARPNMTISAGLRFETQNHIGDHADFAPRVGIAWGLGRGKSAKTVLRAGAGVFYDRFAENYILNAERLNGINQQQYIVPSPDFYPDVPPVSTLSAALLSPAIYQIAPNLRTPYTTQSGIGLERQVTKFITASVTYLNTHGVHQLVTRDINAPDPVNPGDARPNPSLSDLYQYESAGLYNQNQLIANFNVRASKVSLFGFYTLSYVDSNTAGGGSFPMNQYDLEEDYGRAAYDRRNRLFLGGSWNLPKGIQLFPFVVANSSPPVNIVLSNDLGGGEYLPTFNARPAFASSLSNPADVVSTRWGTFDTVPVPGEKIIPINYGTGYDQFTANLRLSKTFAFGKEVQGAGNGGGGGGGHYGRGLGGGGLSSMGNTNVFNRGNTTNRRFNLTFSVSARNIFNNVNFASPEGNLNSPIFGKPYALAGGFFSSNAANRRIDLQVRFNF
ncbi:MAG: carboxypeptidase regulatory-like domain-containing protein [Terriglobia bacterium]